MNPHRMPRCRMERGKIVYDTESEAVNEAARLIARGNPMIVYHCPHGDHFHVGTVYKMRLPKDILR